MKYKMGDTVWFASANSSQKSEPCPDCFGKRYLTVIKGDGEQVTIDCAGCASGYDPPKGFVTYWKWAVDVELVTIDRVEITPKGVTYGFSGFRGRYSADEERLFNTKEEATAKAQLISEEHNAEEIAKIHRKEKHNHTWSWNACYHRRCIKDAEKQLAYHTEKLNVAKEKARDKTNKEGL